MTRSEREHAERRAFNAFETILVQQDVHRYLLDNWAAVFRDITDDHGDPIFPNIPGFEDAVCRLAARVDRGAIAHLRGASGWCTLDYYFNRVAGPDCAQCLLCIKCALLSAGVPAASSADVAAAASTLIAQGM